MLDYQQCEDLLFQSYNRVAAVLTGYDSETRSLMGIRRLFQAAAVPLSIAPTVTVTGSKGKGSTAILCAAILQSAGHRVGLVTSPHFISHRERVRVNGDAITQADFVRIVNELAPLIQQIDATLPEKHYLSPTGLFLAVAMRYFVERDVTALVLEVGRGGLYDDVSLIANQVACLTPIMGEHLDKLGPNVTDVARHKAGVVKTRSTVTTTRQTAEVRQVLADAVRSTGAIQHTLGEDFDMQVAYEGNAQTVQVRLDFAGHTGQFRLQSAAKYLAENLALAYAAAVALDPQAAYADPALIEKTRLPGRCDVIQHQPVVIVDGAINRQSAQAFLDSVLPVQTHPSVLITALPGDKDYQGFLDTLLPHVDQVIITRVSAHHLHFSDAVITYAGSLSAQVINEPDSFKAFEIGLQCAGDTGTIWVVGTQSLVRDALHFWQIDLEQLIRPDV